MHRMSHPEREFPEIEAREILKNSEYVFFSTVCPDGQPYCVPVSIVVDGNTAYIHGAHYGQKIVNIENDSRVCLSCVSQCRRVPEAFTLSYESVVAVGQAMADVLDGRGISTLHCEIMHDVQSYRDSYSRSAATIKEYIDKYPSIKYVIDVHRDSVSDSSGALLRPVTLVNGNVAAAQVMCVVGSDAGGTACPRWQENLSFALRLRSALNSSYGNICRPVCLRGSAYNQQYAPVSLLLEIGASGNYLDEALEAGRLCADALADLIIG